MLAARVDGVYGRRERISSVPDSSRRESHPRPILSQLQYPIAFASDAPCALHGRGILAVLVVIFCRRLTLICNASATMPRSTQTSQSRFVYPK